MIKKNIQVVNKLGLHARAASKLVNEAARFESAVSLNCCGQQADAKSIMEIMMLAASQGADLELAVDGKDEEAALHAIQTLFQNRFGESE